MEEKPTAAFVLSLIAGIFILLGGLVIAALGALLASFFFGVGIVLAIIGLAFGIIVLVGAIMLYMQPEQHVTWGVIILVFSILSIFTALGGFFIGLILGIIGGALAISWKPQQMMMPGYPPGYPAPYGQYAYAQPYAQPPAPPPSAAPPGTSPPQAGARPAVFCRNCGASVTPGAPFCGNCGAPV